MPPPVTLTFDLGVACDLGYPCAKFRLPRPFGFRVRADVLDIRQTDGRTTDADHHLMPPPPTGRGHNKKKVNWVRSGWSVPNKFPGEAIKFQ